MNSRAKGARAEREAAAWLNTLLPVGYEAVRAARIGVDGGEDVMIRDEQGRYANVRVEVKHRATMDLAVKALDEACEQAQADAKGGVWCVLWRRDRRPWVLTTTHLGARVTMDKAHDVGAWLYRLLVN